MSWLLVERPYSERDEDGVPIPVEDAVDCVALSFDGGSLICFEDQAMTKVKVSFGPGGWMRARWAKDGEVRAEPGGA